MAGAEAGNKSDLGVRAASAVVMIMIVAVAAWIGDPAWGWMVLVVGLICYAELLSLVSKAFKSWTKRVFAAVAGVVYVGLAASVLSSLPFGMVYHGSTPDGGKYIGLAILASVVGLVVFTDIGAYFAGRAIGGPKIAPSVSPSKTWAGLVGGMIAAGLWGLVALHLPAAVVAVSDGCSRPLSTYNLAAFLSGAIMAVVAQSGDFLESWLKRRAGVKDSSRLIPGHGGVLDRIDGLLPVAIVYGIFGDWLIFGDLLPA
jgi:phosphatidate cytidylyltransferase